MFRTHRARLTITTVAILITVQALLLIGAAVVLPPQVLKQLLQPLMAWALITTMIAGITVWALASRGEPQEVSEVAGFIRHLAHELRTPLTYLLGRAQLMQRGSPSADEQAKFLSEVIDELSGISKAIEIHALLAKSQAEKDIPRAEPVSVNDVVMDAMKACKPLADQRRVRIIPHLAEPDDQHGEATVTGQAKLIYALIETLLRHAVNCSPISADVNVTIGHAAGDVSITIRDQGPRIPRAKLAGLFEGYKRQHNAIDNGPPGLDLTIARPIAHLHGGTIHASNTDDGARFTVRLPRTHPSP